MNKISKKLEKKKAKRIENEKKANKLQVPGGEDGSDGSKEVNKQGSMMKIEGEEGMDDFKKVDNA